MLILLAGVNSRPAGIAGAHVQNERGLKNVYPSTAIVAALRATAGGTVLSYGSENCVPLLGVAKEHAIGVAEAVVNPHRVTVRVVQCGPVTNEVVGARRVDNIRCRRVGLEELLHGRKDQRLGNFVADHADRLVLLVLGIHGQWVTGGVATESVTHKIHAHLTRRVRIEDLFFERGTGVGEIARKFGCGRNV